MYVGGKLATLIISPLLAGAAVLTAVPADAADSSTAERNSIQTALDEVMAECGGHIALGDIANTCDAYGYVIHNPAEFDQDLNPINPKALPEEKFSIFGQLAEDVKFLQDHGVLAVDDDGQLVAHEQDRMTQLFVNEAAKEELLRENGNEQDRNIPQPSFVLAHVSRMHAWEIRGIYDRTPGPARVKQAVAGSVFATRVMEHGVWDYKDHLRESRYYAPALDKWVTAEYIGNWHYGYVGSTLFRAGTLKSAAGFVQVAVYVISKGDGNVLGPWYTYFDDPRDQEMINDGIVYFRHHHR